METNKWLWQPHKSGPIFIRVSYRDLENNLKIFAKSLRTNNLPIARKIRDTEFSPIILSLDKAKTQLDIIIKRYPELEKQLKCGLHGEYADQKDENEFTIGEVYKVWVQELNSKGGNYQTAERTAKRYSTICQSFVNNVGENTSRKSR